jgi:hypothetical protein
VHEHGGVSARWPQWPVDLLRLRRLSKIKAISF